MLPKIHFEEMQHQTAQTSDLYTYIYLVNSELYDKKEGQATIKRACPILLPTVAFFRTNSSKN
ncbi:hypothetical protein FHS10_002747 [Mucilaginibacter dorajii]|uniref:Uncharacterized protein n=1 Tax=Mucilaginibacter dorajii TaxID=692994 RepID=A0ABP7PD27_9SPHI|nr:hypothetical protein [Mucilaginibacter dorajii]